MTKTLLEPDTRFSASSRRSAARPRSSPRSPSSRPTLFTKAGIAFAAISSDPQALQETISEGQPTLETGIGTLPRQRPFLREFASLARDLRRASPTCGSTLPALNDAIEVGTPVLRDRRRPTGGCEDVFVRAEQARPAAVDADRARSACARRSTRRSRWPSTWCPPDRLQLLELLVHLPARARSPTATRSATASASALPPGSSLRPAGDIPSRRRRRRLLGHPGERPDKAPATRRHGVFEPYRSRSSTPTAYGPDGQTGRTADCQAGQTGYPLGSLPVPGQARREPGARLLATCPGSRGPTTLFYNDDDQRQLVDTRIPSRQPRPGSRWASEASKAAAAELGDRPDPGRGARGRVRTWRSRSSSPGPRLEVKAVFGSAQNMRPDSPVRIAGVNVGKVTDDRAPDQRPTARRSRRRRRRSAGLGRRRGGRPAGGGGDHGAHRRGAARSTRTRPSSCARGCSWRATLRRPAARAARTPPRSRTSHTFPVNQTSYSVQLDQVLTTLQGDVRADLQIFLNQFGNALIKYGGAEGFRELYRASPGAVQVHLAGQPGAASAPSPHDLSGLIREPRLGGARRWTATRPRSRTWSRNFAHRHGLVRGRRTQALERGDRRAARRARGGAARRSPTSTPRSRRSARSPARRCPACARRPRRSTPRRRSCGRSARWSPRPSCAASSPTCARRSRSWRSWRRPASTFLDQSRALSSCFNEVVIPWSENTVEPVDPGGQYPHDPVGRVFEETALRARRDRRREPLGRRQRPVHPGRGRRRREHGGGPELGAGQRRRRPAGRDRPDAPSRCSARCRASTTPLKTPFRPDVPCETQEPPNLEARRRQIRPQQTDTAARRARPTILSQATREASCAPAPKTARAARRGGPDALGRAGVRGERELMATAIRKHLRDFVAVAVLLVIGLGVTYYIVQEQRLRIPILEEKPFELKAEFETAQAVVPGQGQTIRVAGVRVGDVTDVELENGVGVVTFAIDREYLPIYKDATILMRPNTGLKDMFFELDPGTKAAGEYEEGGDDPGRQHGARRQPRRDPRRRSTPTPRPTCACCWSAPARAWRAATRTSASCSAASARSTATSHSSTREVAKRQENLARPGPQPQRAHDQGRRSRRRPHPAGRRLQRAPWARSPSRTRTCSARSPSCRARSARPSTPSARPPSFAAELGPAFDQLRPFARNLRRDERVASARLASDATPVLKDEIRPFVRAARRPVADLEQAADELLGGVTAAHDGLGKINRLGNMAAYNPQRRRAARRRPAATRATCTGPLGSATTETRVFSAGTATASTAGSTSRSAATRSSTFVEPAVAAAGDRRAGDRLHRTRPRYRVPRDSRLRTRCRSKLHPSAGSSSPSASRCRASA